MLVASPVEYDCSYRMCCYCFESVADIRAGGVLLFLGSCRALGEELRGPDGAGVATGQQDKAL